MSVYSTNFFANTLPANTVTVIATSSTETIVVRDMELFNGSSSPLLFNVQIKGAGAAQAIIWAFATLPASQWEQWSGRSVVPPGGQLLAYAAQSGVQLCVSGYLLAP